ncbi:MAG: hypothetical protein V4864_12895 [Pseudomonadota bacterium]
MDLAEFLAKHVSAWGKPTVDAKGFVDLEVDTPVTPKQYLEFAEKDLRLGGTRGLVNALTNSKRAIDCQVHNLLKSLGIPEPYSFPARMEQLQALGLVAPRIIRKIVQLRNVLEHEYYKPAQTEVEDAVDIAALFVATLKPYFAGGAYMDSAWLADELSVNPRGELTRTKTHTTWRHDNEPKFTYARGIFIDSEVGGNSVELTLVHDNVEVGFVAVEAKDTAYLPLQNLLLHAQLNDLVYSRAGANKFLKVLRLAAL